VTLGVGLWLGVWLGVPVGVGVCEGMKVAVRVDTADRVGSGATEGGTMEGREEYEAAADVLPVPLSLLLISLTLAASDEVKDPEMLPVKRAVAACGRVALTETVGLTETKEAEADLDLLLVAVEETDLDLLLVAVEEAEDVDEVVTLVDEVAELEEVAVKESRPSFSCPTSGMMPQNCGALYVMR